MYFSNRSTCSTFYPIATSSNAVILFKVRVKIPTEAKNSVYQRLVIYFEKTPYYCDNI